MAEDKPLKVLDLLRLLWDTYDKRGNIPVYIERSKELYALHDYELTVWHSDGKLPERVVIG